MNRLWDSIISTFFKKLPWKFLFVVLGAVAGILLFSPQSVTKRYGLYHISSGPLRPYIAIFFLIWCVGLTILFLERLYKFIKRKFSYWRWRRNLYNEVKGLDKEAVLREFYLQGKNTINLPINNPTVAGLLEKGFIRVVGNIGEYGFRGIQLPCIMKKEVKELIEKEPGLIELPVSESSEDDLRRLIEKRPDFIRAKKKLGHLFDDI